MNLHRLHRFHFHRFMVCESVCPLQGSESPKSGKEGFRVKCSHFPMPQKWALWVKKIPISLQGSTRKMGILWLKAPISGALGNGSFLTLQPSFPYFSDFDPCRGQMLSQTMVAKPLWGNTPFGDTRGMMSGRSGLNAHPRASRILLNWFAFAFLRKSRFTKLSEISGLLCFLRIIDKMANPAGQERHPDAARQNRRRTIKCLSDA